MLWRASGLLQEENKGSEGEGYNIVELPKFLSKVEEGSPETLLRILKERNISPPLVFGIAGPPGAGKSSLINGLVKIIGRDRKVGVLALDPSSPYSGGSILGDRIRMRECESMEGVYIRSVASQAERSLPPYLNEMILAFSLYGYGFILVETPGVGQTEISIKDYVDYLVLVIPPSSGDDVQFIKSGILEVSDCYVISKWDLDGAKEIMESLRRRILLDGREKPIFPTSTKTGEGIEDLVRWMASKKPKLSVEDRIVGMVKDRALLEIENRLKKVPVEERIKTFIKEPGDNIIREVVSGWLKELSF